MKTLALCFVIFVVAINALVIPQDAGQDVEEVSIRINANNRSHVISNLLEYGGNDFKVLQHFKENVFYFQNNVIEGPVHCPPGQQPDNTGRCRPIYRITLEKMKELIQKYAECLKENGTDHSYMCRPEWELTSPEVISPEVESGPGGFAPKNVIDAPKICPSGQKLDSQGNCRTVYRLPHGSYV